MSNGLPTGRGCYVTNVADIGEGRALGNADVDADVDVDGDAEPIPMPIAMAMAITMSMSMPMLVPVPVPLHSFGAAAVLQDEISMATAAFRKAAAAPLGPYFRENVTKFSLFASKLHAIGLPSYYLKM